MKETKSTDKETLETNKKQIMDERHEKDECVSCGCFRAGKRVSTLTLGRMLTSTSIRSLTVLVFCSKLQLSFPSLSSCQCL